MPALRADAEVRLELVVPVVRLARRAGVRVLCGSVGVVGAMLVLDRDVYAWLCQGPSIIAQMFGGAERSAPPARRAVASEPSAALLEDQVRPLDVHPGPLVDPHGTRRVLGVDSEPDRLESSHGELGECLLEQRPTHAL